MSNGEKSSDPKPWHDPDDPVRQELSGEFEKLTRPNEGRKKLHDKRIEKLARIPLRNWAHPMYNNGRDLDPRYITKMPISRGPVIFKKDETGLYRQEGSNIDIVKD